VKIPDKNHFAAGRRVVSAPAILKIQNENTEQTIAAGRMTFVGATGL
jgi:hypothetical protein